MRWPPIVNAAHQQLHDALQGGTAKLLARGADGRTLDAYGETATVDSRFDVYAPGARLIAADKVNREATLLVFVTGGGFWAR
ncbi:hypothetical protein BN2476_1240028 [Paraburkholderia piptadeniae]|uniref:Uncharacterized protein n=2 Tax=Paraburkholderia piptadeniae TaxID=1701573 RepID=A0A1N7SW38_9BURK|nr:hypothetical protein BN2476_1240028 [Paraburkholderia piptadeniae]